MNDFHSGTQNTQKPQQIDFYEGFDPTRGNPDHARFMDLINASERRGQIKNIVHEFAGITSPIHTAALVNGSGMGEPVGIPPARLYATMRHNVGLDMDLTSGQADSLDTKVFFADITGVFPIIPGKDPASYSLKEPAFMENVPGGLRNTYLEIRKTIEGTQAWDSQDAGFVNHAFIPTLSGLGILTRDLNRNESWYRALKADCDPPTMPPPPPLPPLPPWCLG